ncbi:hypothetical protein Bpfe_030073 [Biomphalaria pfeifferi]|uniref:Uncharacterized protein n=1 Tax=Biomphalaria pfeifferi TaxID=112525 RepID=A0AAD8EUL1_BIOPF|nr:hypothetical protein Bpfe_030073 [Biomphalaria pfeifferi]
MKLLPIFQRHLEMSQRLRPFSCFAKQAHTNVVAVGEDEDISVSPSQPDSTQLSYLREIKSRLVCMDDTI